MSTDLITLGFSNLSAQSGSHIAYPFRDEDQRREHLFSYVEEGLSRNEKCITAICEYPSDLWLQGLHKRGINHQSLPDGQLQILTPGNLFGVCGVGTPYEAIRRIFQTVEDARREGWSSVRICTSFDHLLHDEGHLRSILQNLYNVNTLIDMSFTTALSTFDASHLHPELIDLFLIRHRYVTDGNSLIRNIDFSESADESISHLEKISRAGVFVRPFATLDFINDTPMIHIVGEMDGYTSPAVEELARSLINMGHKCLLLDLGETTFMDASSVSLMFRISSVLENVGGQLAIYDPLDPPRKIFQLIQMSDRIPVYISYGEAEYAMRVALHSS